MNKKNTLLVVWLIAGLLLALTVGLCSNSKSQTFDVREYSGYDAFKSGVINMGNNGYKVHDFEVTVKGDYSAAFYTKTFIVIFVK